MKSNSFSSTAGGAFLAVATILFGAACDRVKAPPMAMQDPLPGEAYPAVVLEGGIERSLVVDYDKIVSVAATSSTPLTVAVPIRSKADVQMRIQYEFRWFDEKHMEIGTSGLKFAVVEARRQIQLQGNSLTSKAKGWRVEVRAAR